MSDNASVLIKKRKQERITLRQKTMDLIYMNGGRMPRRQLAHSAKSAIDEEVTGQFGNHYNNEKDDDYLPRPRPKTQNELEFEEKINEIRINQSTPYMSRDVLVKVNYKLSDFDEEAEEKKKAFEARRLADLKKREINEEKRLRKV